jgi:hypothetical protein
MAFHQTTTETLKISLICLLLVLSRNVTAIGVGQIFEAAEPFFGLGLDIVIDRYDDSNPCQKTSTGKDPKNAMRVMGSAVGAVLGAAVGGDLKSIGSGAAFGYSGGEGSAVLLHHNQSDIAKRDEQVCEKLQAGLNLLDPIIDEMGETFQPLCGLYEGEIYSDTSGTLRKIEVCSSNNIQAKSEFDKYKSMVYGQNHQTCLSVQALLKKWDKKLAEQALKEGSSYIPALDPHPKKTGYDCN